jgi:hypothetical protein
MRRHAGGDRMMAQVLAAVPTAGLDAVLVAVELVVESGALSAEHVLNVVARLNAEPPPIVETTLQLKEPPLANTSRYDSLRGAVEPPRRSAMRDVTTELKELRLHGMATPGRI